MTRNGTCVLLLLAAAGRGAADEALVDRWEKPTRDTFSLKGALPADVADEVRKRYGIAFEADVLALPRMDFAVKDATFFEALDQFAAAHRLLVVGSPARGASDLALVRPKRALPAVAVSHAGPVRLSVQGISVLAAMHWTPETPPRPTRRAPLLEELLSLRAIGGRDEPGLRIRFKWIAEPGFGEAMLVGWSAGRAEDDLGRTLAVALAPRLPVAADCGFDVDFEVPAANAKAVARLEGRMRFALPAGSGEVEFLATDAWQRKPFGDAHVVLEEVDARDSVVRFTVLGTPCEALASTDTTDDPVVRVGSSEQAPATALRVLGCRADGTEIAGSLTRRWSNVGSPNRTYWVDLDEAPHRIVLRSTTAAVVRDAPFTFKDIPLPR